jgi:hypothetical protein
MWYVFHQGTFSCLFKNPIPFDFDLKFIPPHPRRETYMVWGIHTNCGTERHMQASGITHIFTVNSTLDLKAWCYSNSLHHHQL